MSLKPQPPRPMPEETANVVGSLLPTDSPYKLVGDELYEQYNEADYVDLYHTEGKPGISPVDLAFVTAFQFMENLSDREAAEALRLRLNWKYALHLPLDYAGLNYSVLSEFRDRVIEHQAEARVFESVLKQLQTLGLIKRRGRQRTDSLAVLTKVRDLNRLERVVETLRLALQALLQEDPMWTRATVPPTWEERYATRCVAERLKEDERRVLAEEVGRNGQWLLERLQAETTPAALRQLPAVQVLATVWKQITKLCPTSRPAW
jgi:transposase